jgi:chemotaxis signal transduction protein
VSDGGADRLIGFHLDGAGAALPLAIVREVTERPRVVRVPGTHPFVSGVTLHGGVALPVYDLRRFESLWSGREDAGHRAGAADADRLIVCDWGEIALGLLGGRVDLVEDAGEARGGEGREDMRCGMSGDFVKRVLRFHGEAIALLDTDRLFASLGVPAAEPRGRRETGEDDPAGG